jgi:hypothetical protein
MNDKELLELAAKAAGIEVVWGDVKTFADGTVVDCSDMLYIKTNGAYWNPLANNADALRLAVKLGKRDYFGIEIQKGCTQATSFEPWEHCEYEEHNNDPEAATRRAIVRAAAEIRGRAE